MGGFSCWGVFFFFKFSQYSLPSSHTSQNKTQPIFLFTTVWYQDDTTGWWVVPSNLERSKLLWQLSLPLIFFHNEVISLYIYKTHLKMLVLRSLCNIKVTAASQKLPHETEKCGRLQLHTFFWQSCSLWGLRLLTITKMKWNCKCSLVLP